MEYVSKLWINTKVNPRKHKSLCWALSTETCLWKSIYLTYAALTHVSPIFRLILTIPVSWNLPSTVTILKLQLRGLGSLLSNNVFPERWMMEKFKPSLKPSLFSTVSTYKIGEGYGFPSFPLGMYAGEEINEKLN